MTCGIIVLGIAHINCQTCQDANPVAYIAVTEEMSLRGHRNIIVYLGQERPRSLATYYKKFNTQLKYHRTDTNPFLYCAAAALLQHAYSITQYTDILHLPIIKLH